MEIRTKLEWESYCTIELGILEPILADLGYRIADEQHHIKGERFLMQAVTTQSGKKLILTGTRKDGKRAIIKATRDDAGKKEISHERACRNLLHSINFAAEVFHSPKELLYTESHGFLISIQEFIKQEKTFLEHPIEQQFDLALDAFKAQEGAHATTYRHIQNIKKIFEFRNAHTYLKNFEGFIALTAEHLPENRQLRSVLRNAEDELREHERTIEQYCGFLTHTDFVPHNIRINDGVMYLLDHSSLAFGNKHEGWARFLNFMTLYNPELQRGLELYVEKNRAPEEVASLRLMRLYRLGEIICYYVGTLERSEGDLKLLNKARVDFWKTILSYKLENTPVPEDIVLDYKKTRDSLRSDDEKRRQRGLH